MTVPGHYAFQPQRVGSRLFPMARPKTAVTLSLDAPLPPSGYSLIIVCPDLFKDEGANKYDPQRRFAPGGETPIPLFSPSEGSEYFLPPANGVSV